MNLLLDLGNSRLKLACHDDVGLGAVQAIAHRDNPQFAEHLATALASIDARQALLASVQHGDAQRSVLSALAARGWPTRQIQCAEQRADLRLAYPDLSQLGVDRWLGMLGARSQHLGDLLLVSAGTAITIDLLDATGRHHGGCIAAPPQAMIDGLRLHAPHLPAVPVAANTSDLFADNTVDALAAAAEGAVLGLLDEARRQAEQRLAAAPKLLLSGGAASRLLARLPDSWQAECIDFAVLKGLARLLPSPPVES